MRITAEVLQLRARRIANDHSNSIRATVTPMSRTCACLCSLLLVFFAFGLPSDARAEYGDVVINNIAEETGVNPVIFPHWFHRIRYTCKVCHTDLNFQMKAGGNKMSMGDIAEGRFCGACHNGQIAWAIDNCDLCHSAKPKTQTQIHGRSLPQLSGGTATSVTEPSRSPK